MVNEVKYDDEMKHSGIATFVGSEYEELSNVKNYDVAVLGIPIDMGATYRLGTCEAPRAIREHSMWKKMKAVKCYDYDNREYVVTNEVNICDLGDVCVWHGDMEKTQQEIIQTVEKISKTTLPVILGGDHSITYGAYIGVKNGTNLKNIGLLQFDAHNDTEPDTPYFSRINHSNQFTNLINEGYLDGNHMVNIGVRGFVNAVWHEFAIEHGITHITSNEFNKMEIEEVIEILKKQFKDCDGIYVTFDMDSLELAYSMGTGTPKYNGINGMKTLELIRRLKEFTIVGFDVVELCPRQDATGVTSFIAWEILNNFLSLGYDSSKRNNLLKKG